MSSLWLKIRDLTLPIVSLLKGTQLNRSVVRVFKDAKFEDAWIPCFAVAVDLTDSREVVIRNGFIWKYVRGSMSLCGFVPPICDVIEGEADKVHYLVDGGYSNNLPIDHMRGKLSFSA